MSIQTVSPGIWYASYMKKIKKIWTISNFFPDRVNAFNPYGGACEVSNTWSGEMKNINCISAKIRE